MLTLKEYFELIDYKITGGSPYGWNCFGPNASYIDSNSMEYNGTEDYGFSIVFDTKTQRVYSAEVHDYRNHRSYRMIDPEFRAAYNAESIEIMGELEKDIAYDDIKFIDLEIDQDFVKKTRAILTGSEYDTRVSMPIDLSDEEIFRLMRIAHDRDITLNKLVEEILTEQINRELAK